MCGEASRLCCLLLLRVLAERVPAEGAAKQVSSRRVDRVIVFHTNLRDSCLSLLVQNSIADLMPMIS